MVQTSITLSPDGSVTTDGDVPLTGAPPDAADGLTEALVAGGYDIAFDTAALPAAPETVNDDDTAEAEGESTLPSQAVASRVGRPSDSPAVLIEGSEDQPGDRKYLGTDGHQHIESPRARQAFEDYLNMGATRTLAKLAEKYHIEKPTGWENNTSLQATLRKLSEYSANLGWRDRIRLTLARQTALAVTNAQKQAAANRTERLRRSQKMQQIAEHIFDRAAILDTDEVELPPEVARALIKPAIQLMEIGMINERLEAGESLERIKPPKPIDQMNEAELDEYIDLLRSER